MCRWSHTFIGNCHFYQITASAYCSLFSFCFSFSSIADHAAVPMQAVRLRKVIKFHKIYRECDVISIQIIMKTWYAHRIRESQCSISSRLCGYYFLFFSRDFNFFDSFSFFFFNSIFYFFLVSISVSKGITEAFVGDILFAWAGSQCVQSELLWEEKNCLKKYTRVAHVCIWPTKGVGFNVW